MMDVYERRYGMICPQCLSEFVLEEKSEFIIKGVGVTDMTIHCEPDVVCECYNCKKTTQMIVVDEHMGPIIKKFLEKGWDTEFCCESHDGLFFTSAQAYIVFSRDVSLMLMLEINRCIRNKKSYMEYLKVDESFLNNNGRVRIFYDGNDKEDFLSAIMSFADDIGNYKVPFNGENYIIER